MDDFDDEVIILGHGYSSDDSDEVPFPEVISLFVNSQPCAERDELMKQTLITFGGGDTEEDLEEDLPRVDANNGEPVLVSINVFGLFW